MKIKRSIERYGFLIRNQIIKWNRQTKLGILAGLAGCVVLGAVLFMASGAEVYSLSIAGRDAGYITDKALIDGVIKEIKIEYSNTKDGADVSVDRDAIACKGTELEESDITALTAEELKNKLIASDLCTVKGWVISADGKTIVSVKSKVEADQILTNVKSHFLTSGSKVINASFKENVIITQAAVKVTDFIGSEEAESLILTGEKASEIYTVKEGDTLWDIAATNGTSPNELQNANPGFDPNELKIGQQLNLFAVKPYMTVATKELIVSTEKIDFDTVYEETDSLYKGETKVKTAGVYGSKEVTSEVTKENGTVIAANVVESVVTAQPQNQVSLKGTKPKADYVASRGGGRPVSVTASGNDIVAYAETLIGVPYASGGSTPKGFDCSGFTRYVYGHFDGSLPHSSASQYGYGVAVEKSALQPGDLVFFSKSSRISHVGIYVGGGKFIHSPQPGQSVEISSFSYSNMHYAGAVRITE